MLVVAIVSIILALLSLAAAIISMLASMRYSRRLSEWSKHVVDEANKCICVNCEALKTRIEKLEANELP